MALPRVSLRGGVYVADLRSVGGSQRQSLGLGPEASQIEVGVALARAMDACRLGAKVSQPELPGLDDGGLRIDRLVEMYRDARDYDTPKGASYVNDCCRRAVEGIGHLTVRDLAAPGGAAVLKAWRDRMWKDEWSPKSVRNVLNFAKAVLTWGQDDGRALTGPIPKLPKFCRPGEFLDGKPCYDTMTEVDFRHFREHWADEGLRWGGFNKKFRNPVDRDDYIERRKLYLSFAFYTGAHPEDCNTLQGQCLNVFAGRYERHNTKSARVIRPECFDMPDQLRLDCEAELRRRGIPFFQEKELPAGGPWNGATRSFAKTCKALWPDGSRKPFTFRLARRSTVWEYTVRGWRTHEIAQLLGHVDEKMVREIYRRCSELGIVSPVRVPWTLASGPHGGPSRLAPTLPFVGRKNA